MSNRVCVYQKDGVENARCPQPLVPGWHAAQGDDLDNEAEDDAHGAGHGHAGRGVQLEGGLGKESKCASNN